MEDDHNKRWPTDDHRHPAPSQFGTSCPHHKGQHVSAPGATEPSTCGCQKTEEPGTAGRTTTSPNGAGTSIQGDGNTTTSPLQYGASIIPPTSGSGTSSSPQEPSRTSTQDPWGIPELFDAATMTSLNARLKNSMQAEQERKKKLIARAKRTLFLGWAGRLITAAGAAALATLYFREGDIYSGIFFAAITTYNVYSAGSINQSLTVVEEIEVRR